jgi:Asp-tRNA(Asn)/Glu-tRNA(Gln) amidotransferase A subunit family amidase
MSELHELGAAEAIARFRARSLSPVDLMRAVFERAGKVEPILNAFTDTYYDEALEAAARAEERYARGVARPLEGIPLAVKDESAMAGRRTTQGSLIFKDHVDTHTSFCIERLLEAGAIVHARSTAPEFSAATVTHSRLWGVTRNPWSPEHTCGGSSGGAGAALAAGSTTLATGSDIAGSIRIPASCCGVVGFKPPYGRVPEESPWNLDFYCHEGPLARSVADCALLENAMAGPHPLDVTSLRPKLEIPAEHAPIEGWRIAACVDLGFCAVDPEVRRNTERALQVFRDLGCRVEWVELGWTAEVLEAAKVHLGHLFGNLIAGEVDRHPDLVMGYTRQLAEIGRRTRAEDFLEALATVGRMYATLGPLLETHELLVCPTTALPAVAADFDPSVDALRIDGTSVDPILGWVMTHPFNMLSRCPVLSVPSGRAANGVPTGIQLVGRTYDDVAVFRAAAAYERALGGFARPSGPF